MIDYLAPLAFGLLVVLVAWLWIRARGRQLERVVREATAARAARFRSTCLGSRSYVADGPVREGQAVVLSEDGKSVRAHRGEADYREALVGVVVNIEPGASTESIVDMITRDAKGSPS